MNVIQRLQGITSIFHHKFDHFKMAYDIADKRENLGVSLYDLPNLVENYKKRKKILIKKEGIHETHRIDNLPRIRLVNALESNANNLYSLSEILALFANRVSQGEIPQQFNKIRKKLEKGTLSTELAQILGDLQWYKKIREIRTESVHFSSIFIGEENNDPLFIVKAFRKTTDREEFPEKIQFKMPEFITWSKNAALIMDKFTEFLIHKYIVPSFIPYLEEIVTEIIRDQNGFPIFTAPGRIEITTITVREHLKKYGFTKLT